jgi:hypothetical protein
LAPEREKKITHVQNKRRVNKTTKKSEQKDKQK